MTDTFDRLTTDDVDDVGWTLDGTEAIPQAETEGKTTDPSGDRGYTHFCGTFTFRSEDWSG